MTDDFQNQFNKVLDKLQTHDEYQKKEGVKFDAGKPELDLISTYATEELAKVLSFGAKKYGKYNWTKGIVFSRCLAAAKRHMLAWENRIDCDEETGTNHLANAMANLMFILDAQIREQHHLDDRRAKETLKK